MIGVTLVVKGTHLGHRVERRRQLHASTVPYAGATLMVSYIGYAPQEIA